MQHTPVAASGHPTVTTEAESLIRAHPRWQQPWLEKNADAEDACPNPWRCGCRRNALLEIVAGPLARLSREETGVMTASHPPSLTVGGIEVGLSNTDKVLYPGDEITKGDLIEYYGEMACRMPPYLRDRPIAMARYPDGIAGHRIFQKNVPDNFPDWVTRAEVEKQDGVLRQVICDKPATLVYLANQACIELHVFLSRASPARPPRSAGH